ncbi:MAG: coiled-coil domain-containing protein [Candidatus Hodarchaeota archaeon]
MRYERGVIVISQDEIKDLTSDLDDKIVKALQNKVNTYEAEITELKNILEKKDDEIANLAKSKDNLISELEDFKGKMSERGNQANKLDKLNSEVYDLKKTITLKDDGLKKLNAEMDDLKLKLAELTKNNEELKNFINEKESKIKELSESLIEKEKAFNEQKAKLEKAETELSAIKTPEPTEYISKERLVCPKCGARGKDLKVEEDKSKILGYIGHAPMYGKTNVCKKCGKTF